jgi:hypothetical protein
MSGCQVWNAPREVCHLDSSQFSALLDGMCMSNTVCLQLWGLCLVLRQGCQPGASAASDKQGATQVSKRATRANSWAGCFAMQHYQSALGTATVKPGSLGSLCLAPMCKCSYQVQLSQISGCAVTASSDDLMVGHVWWLLALLFPFWLKPEWVGRRRRGLRRGHDV